MASTKAGRIEGMLRRRIQAGHWMPGEALPTEREMRVELGVSHATLREALSALANEGLLVRRHGSGTYVSEHISAGTIAILVKHNCVATPMGYWYRNLIEEAIVRIEKMGYRSVLMIGRGDTPEAFISSLNLFDETNMKSTLGVLGLMDLSLLEWRLAEAGIHCVSVETTLPGARHSIVLDFECLMEWAAGMLNTYGYDDFAVMYLDESGVPVDGIGGSQDEEGTRLKKAIVGLDQSRLVPVPWTPDCGHAYEAFKQWWSKPDRPNSMFFSDDTLFDVASRAIVELGIKVPDELGIVTHANTRRQFHFPMELTSIGYDAAQVIDAAWDMLHALVTGQQVEVPVQYVLPTVHKGRSLLDSREVYARNLTKPDRPSVKTRLRPARVDDEAGNSLTCTTAKGV